MEIYPRAAVERAMKIQEVILRAVAKKITWVQAAEILGLCERQMRRWKERYRSSAMTDCSITAWGSPVRNVYRWRRWRRFCACIKRSTGIATCGIFTRSCAISTTAG
jgi:hypothetical protein